MFIKICGFNLRSGRSDDMFSEGLGAGETEGDAPVVEKEETGKWKKWKRIFLVILCIWLGKILLCVGIREYRNYQFMRLSNPKGKRVLRIEREIHFFDLKYGIFGISYHYFVSVYDGINDAHRGAYIGDSDYGEFRISLLHYGYIQDFWPMYLYSDTHLADYID